MKGYLKIFLILVCVNSGFSQDSVSYHKWFIGASVGLSMPVKMGNNEDTLLNSPYAKRGICYEIDGGYELNKHVSLGLGFNFNSNKIDESAVKDVFDHYAYFYQVNNGENIYAKPYKRYDLVIAPEFMIGSEKVKWFSNISFGLSYYSSAALKLKYQWSNSYGSYTEIDQYSTQDKIGFIFIPCVGAKCKMNNKFLISFAVKCNVLPNNIKQYFAQGGGRWQVINEDGSIDDFLKTNLNFIQTTIGLKYII